MVSPSASKRVCIALGTLLASCTLPPPETTLQGAARNYPPLILGANTTAQSGVSPKPCPDPGAKVEQKGGPTFEYLGSVPDEPDLCRMRVGGDEATAWFGIWLTSWPGADAAYPVLKQVMHGRTGDVQGIDVVMGPGFAYHDMIRNEGVEDIPLLGVTYHALKLSHYREGFDGNTYRSVSTIWKDIPTGMLIYGTYQHISGTPVIDDPLIPTAITPAPR
jgi:hypothetical protein